jgi:hypothetical protein
MEMRIWDLRRYDWVRPSVEKREVRRPKNVAWRRMAEPSTSSEGSEDGPDRADVPAFCRLGSEGAEISSAARCRVARRVRRLHHGAGVTAYRRAASDPANVDRGALQVHRDVQHSVQSRAGEAQWLSTGDEARPGRPSGGRRTADLTAAPSVFTA